MSPSPAGVDGRHVVLVGLMGAGKTTVGERLAARLDRPFVDTDDLVEAAAGSTVAEIFATSGEAAFRRLERTAVADACASPTPLVIACGGGAVLDAENRRTLSRAGIVVWLRADASELAARVGGGDDRPLLAGGSPVETLERLQQVRAASYETVADVTVDTDGLDPDAVTTRVLEEVTACAA
jgi:shikimate kinase/3-dehydroquinate synthase